MASGSPPPSPQPAEPVDAPNRAAESPPPPPSLAAGMPAPAAAAAAAPPPPPPPPPAAPPRSCLHAFDALYYCYSPGHQFTTYYRDGTIDSCTGKLADLLRCGRARLADPTATAATAAAAASEAATTAGDGSEVAPLPPPVWAPRPSFLEAIAAAEAAEAAERAAGRVPADDDNGDGWWLR
ncbi:hypothetical protein MMPV_001551 [Pyropia vietnamensis]